jgi:lipopolysaccharide export system protein LptC
VVISQAQSRRKTLNFLKKLLPLLAIALVIMLSMWSYAKRIIFSELPKTLPQVSMELNDNTALKINYHGEDSGGRPFTLTALKGEEVNPEEVFLTEPFITLNLSNKIDKVTLKAKEGLFNKTKKCLNISGAVVLKHTNGLVMRTSEAFIKFEEGEAIGHSPVEGETDSAIINAQGFKILNQGEKIIFTGQSQLIINNSR